MSEFSGIEDIRTFVKEWNLKYPIDRWWREKFNIPFGSPQHLNQDVLDMRFAFEEDDLYSKIEAKHIKEAIEAKEKEEEDKDKIEINPYQPGHGNWLKSNGGFVEMSSEEIDSIFNEGMSDLSKIDDIFKNI